jgi:large subunit ribosomal protein L21
MYAVIKTGGKQYVVKKGDFLKVEKLPVESGSQYEFSDVLLVGNGDAVTVGEPLISGAKVLAEVVEQGKGDKVIIIKFRRRKHYDKKQGHRQLYTKVKITDIIQ